MLVDILVIVISAALGWGFSYFIWFAYPQILVTLGIWEASQATLNFPGGPPLYFQIGWIIVGALYIRKNSFVNKIINQQK
jgi:hypothetical protein